VSEKRVLLREAARRDLETAVDYYAKVAGSGVALGFIDALQSAIGSLPSAHPWVASLYAGTRPSRLAQLASEGVSIPHVLHRTRRPHRYLARAPRPSRYPVPHARTGRVRCAKAMISHPRDDYWDHAAPARFQPRARSPKASQPVSVTATVSSSLMKPRRGCAIVVSIEMTMPDSSGRSASWAE
jgi:plasmid stabilization system protein ParE